jgi:hypothetical protein
MCPMIIACQMIREFPHHHKASDLASDFLLVKYGHSCHHMGNSMSVPTTKKSQVG